MQVHQAGVRTPASYGPLGAIIIERSLSAQPSLQMVSCSDIISREDVDSAEAAKQDIFSRPPSDPTQLLQSVTCRLVVEIGKTFEFGAVLGKSAGELDNGAALVVAEAECA